MPSPDSRFNELNDSYQDRNLKRRRCQQKERKSKIHRRVSLTSNSHAENDANSSDLPPRSIGEDGHYYECIICETGGNLLCCDTCPRTYHIQCLSPALESVPAGNWQCQNCSQGADLSTPLSSLQKRKNKASSNKSPPAGALHSLAYTSERSVVIDETQNDLNQNGDANMRDNPASVNGFIVYKRRAKKKALEGVGKPSIDTSEKTDKFTENNAINASMKLKESDPKPQNKMLLQSLNAIDSTQVRNINQANKLWFLRDTIQDLVKSQDLMQASNNGGKDLCRAVPKRSSETIKEKYVRLRSRQKQRVALRNTNDAVAPSPRIRINAGITESVRVHTPQNGLKQPVLLNPFPLTYTTPYVDHFYSSINSCQNLSIVQDPRKIHWIQDELASLQILNSIGVARGGNCYPWMIWGSNIASSSNLTRNVESIMMMSNNSEENREMMTFWSGQELDSLWVGVRKFGQGNWEKILKDPSLCFSKLKSPQDLALRWNMERLKILNSGGLATTHDSDNLVSTDLRLNSLLPSKYQLNSNPRKRVAQTFLLGGINGNCMANIDLQLQMSADEKQVFESEENGFSSEGTISE